MARILVIDDYEAIREGLVRTLEREGHQAKAVASGPEGLQALRQEPFDVVITDYRMEEMDGLAVLRAVRAEFPDIDVLILTAYGTIDLAVEAMREGAFDFIEKDKRLDLVVPAKVAKALEYRAVRCERERLGEENLYLRQEIGERYNDGEIVGTSAAMLQVLETVRKVAASESSVLIYGESGTGKELVARAIHLHSPRRDGPFVKVNCGALPHELVESELFGHERGSFTGAVRQKRGKFELAEGGTVFLDEIGDVPPDAQVKLLRVLQEKRFERIGGEQTLTAHVRVVAATHRDLQDMVHRGLFREDLFYRLEVIPIRLPPLRERPGDIRPLVEHFLAKKSREMNRPPKRLTADACAALERYCWPGNVRELENVIERTLVLTDGEEVTASDLPLSPQQRSPDAAADAVGATLPLGVVPLHDLLDQIERQLVVRAMAQADQVKTRAAEILQIKPSALYYKLEKYGLG